MSEQDEYAPSLGGTRAQPEPPPAPEPQPVPPSGPTAGPDPEFPPELAAFLGPLGRLAELFADAANAPDGSPGGAPRPTYAPGTPDGAIDALLTDTLRSFADRLTPAFAAFGTIVDAVEEAITPIIGELSNSLAEVRAQQVQAATQEAATEEAAAQAGAAQASAAQAAGEIFDAVPMEPEIPAVDLPPGA